MTLPRVVLALAALFASVPAFAADPVAVLEELYVRHQQERQQIWQYQEETQEPIQVRLNELAALERNNRREKSVTFEKLYAEAVAKQPWLRESASSWRASFYDLQSRQEKENIALDQELVAQNVDNLAMEQAVERLQAKHFAEMRAVIVKYFGLDRK